MTAPRVGFILCSSVAQPIPSTRIAVLNMLPFLEYAGMRPIVLFTPEYPNETPDVSGTASLAIDAACDIVVLQKIHGPKAIALAKQLANAGIHTVYSTCDHVNIQMVEACDATIVVTDYLKSLLPPQLSSRTYVVHDGIERPAECKINWSSGSERHNEPLNAVLVTSSKLDQLPAMHLPPTWLNIRIIGRYSQGLARLREIRWTWATLQRGEYLNYLRFLSNRHIECIPWQKETVHQQLTQADIGVIPIDTTSSKVNSDLPPSWKIKSENRLTLKMSIGLPVVATPIPSYESVIEHGVNGFFARSPQDWGKCLSALRDPALRKEIGMAARASVTGKFSMQAQATRLIDVLLNVFSKKKLLRASSNGSATDLSPSHQHFTP